jgi:hypothetical protein
MKIEAAGTSESLCSFAGHAAHIAGDDIKLKSRLQVNHQTTRITHAPEKLLHQQGAHTELTTI